MSPAVSPRSSSKGDRGLRQSPLRVGFVGRLSPEKDPELFGRIANVNPQHSFQAFGSGQLEESLKMKYPGVDWHGHVATQQAFHALDIMLLTSRSEGLGLVVLEASQYGVIPLCVDVGGVSETLHPDLHQILLVPEQERDNLFFWSERIDAITKDDMPIRIMELQREWLMRFSGEKSAEEFVQALEKGVL